MAKERKYFTFYRSFYDQICECPDKDARLEMYEVMLDYLLNGVEPDLENGGFCHYTKFFWKGNWPVLRKNRAQFENANDPDDDDDDEKKPKSSQRRAKVKPKSSQRQTYNRGIDNIEIVYSKQSRTIEGEGEKKEGIFCPPALEDVLIYYSSNHGTEIESSIAKKFINYYAARGWRMGKVMMTDWRAAFDSWCDKETEFNHKNTHNDEDDSTTSEQRSAELEQLRSEQRAAEARIAGEVRGA